MRARIRTAGVFRSGNWRPVIALWCSAIPCAAPDDRISKAQTIKAAQIEARIGKRLERSRNIEVRLRPGNVVAGAGVIGNAGSLELFADAAKKQRITLVDVRSIDEVQFTTRSRADRTVGGVLGGLGDAVLGGLLAFSLGSGGHDQATLAALIVTPAVGAIAGVKLSGQERWERVVIRE